MTTGKVTPDERTDGRAGHGYCGGRPGDAGDEARRQIPSDRPHLHDGEQVALGGTTLTAHLTPGHTKGCTTWTLKAEEGGKTYDVVIVGSMGVNP